MLWYCSASATTSSTCSRWRPGSGCTPLLPGRGVIKDIPLGFEAECRSFVEDMPDGSASTERCSTATRSTCSGTRGSASSPASEAGARRDRAAAARGRRALGLRKTFDYLAYRSWTPRSRSAPSATTTTLPGADGGDGGVGEHRRPGAGPARRTGPPSPTTARRAAATLGAIDLDGEPDPPLQARHRGLPSRSRQGLLRDREPARELGCFVLADGSSKPLGHFRDPLRNLQAFKDMALNSYVADMICIFGMLDPILEVSTMAPWTAPAAATRTSGRRRGHRGARPGPYLRGLSPSCTKSAARRNCGKRIETLMGRYPDRHSASIPALWAVQERYGWCTPEGGSARPPR